ncbi:MAG: hypothetical protein ACOYOV_16450, partial [Bacteroidales bacterium]
CRKKQKENKQNPGFHIIGFIYRTNASIEYLIQRNFGNPFSGNNASLRIILQSQTKQQKNQQFMIW